MKKKKYLKGGIEVAGHFNKTYPFLETGVLTERYALELMQKKRLPSEDGKKPYRMDITSAYPADPNVNLDGIQEIAEHAGVDPRTINRWVKTCSDFIIEHLWHGSRAVSCQNSVDSFVEKHSLQIKQTHKEILKQYTDPSHG